VLTQRPALCQSLHLFISSSLHRLQIGARPTKCGLLKTTAPEPAHCIRPQAPVPHQGLPCMGWGTNRIDPSGLHVRGLTPEIQAFHAFAAPLRGGLTVAAIDSGLEILPQPVTLHRVGDRFAAVPGGAVWRVGIVTLPAALFSTARLPVEPNNPGHSLSRQFEPHSIPGNCADHESCEPLRHPRLHFPTAIETDRQAQEGADRHDHARCMSRLYIHGGIVAAGPVRASHAKSADRNENGLFDGSITKTTSPHAPGIAPRGRLDS
jgi:hypothetical protein